MPIPFRGLQGDSHVDGGGLALLFYGPYPYFMSIILRQVSYGEGRAPLSQGLW